MGSPSRQIKKEQRPIKTVKKKLNPLYIIIPTVFDISETLCSNVALTLLAASVT